MPPTVIGQDPQDELEGFLTGGFQRQHELLQSEADIHEENAMAYLQKTLRAQPEISPSQGIASALLAAIPTFGGYLLGKGIGAPKIDPNMPVGSFAEYSKIAGGSGANVGGMQGAKIGADAATGYYDELRSNQEQANKAYQSMASSELRRSADAQAKDASVVQSGLNRQAMLEAEQLRRQSTIDAENREADRKRIDPAVLAAIESGQPTPPGALTSTDQLNAIANYQNSKRLDEQLDYRKDLSELPGYQNLSKMPMPPATVQRVLKEKQAVARNSALLDEFIAAPEKFVGQESAVAKTIEALLFQAQRIATNSGATLTNNESEYLKSGIPAALSGDTLRWFKDNMLGRDQKKFAATLKGLYEKTFDLEVAETYGRFRSDVPAGYYPPSLLQKWGYRDASPQSAPAPQAAPTPQTGLNKQDPAYLAILERKRKEKGL